MRNGHEHGHGGVELILITDEETNVKAYIAINDTV